MNDINQARYTWIILVIVLVILCFIEFLIDFIE